MKKVLPRSAIAIAIAGAACGGAPRPAPPAPVAPAATVAIAPVAEGIAYADPWAPPKAVTIPPDWLEHRAENAKPSAAYRWTSVILEASGRDIVAVGAPRPTIISRQMALPLTAMYDAWACYDAKAVGTRLGGTLRRPPAERTDKNKEKAIAYAAYRLLLDQFPADKDWIAGQLRAAGFDPADGSKDRTTPQGIGNLVAEALIAYRQHDGANQSGDEIGSNGKPYSDWTFYEPKNPIAQTRDPDRWQQIGFDDGKGGKVYPSFLTPHWYRVRPLVLERADRFRPGPQPTVGSTQLKREVDEVIAFNGGLSLEQKSVVEFMRDGPRSTGQSGHWLQFAQDVSRRDRLGLDQDVKLFFAVANTAFEAFIAAWDTKRFYDTARPFALVRLVQELYADKTVRGYLGPGKGFGWLPAKQWHPYSPGTFVTPPFPGYVSGHSTVSGACAKMLELFTGSDHLGVYHQHVAGQYTEPDAKVAQMQAIDGRPAGLPEDKRVVLAMPTFSGTADMAGLSRVMGGYHIQTDNVEGLKLGRAVAEDEWPKYRAYFEGEAGRP